MIEVYLDKKRIAIANGLLEVTSLIKALPEAERYRFSIRVVK